MAATGHLFEDVMATCHHPPCIPDEVACKPSHTSGPSDSFGGNMVSAVCSTVVEQTHSGIPTSWGGREAVPCEDTREDFGLSTSCHKCDCSVAFKVTEGQTVSGKPGLCGPNGLPPGDPGVAKAPSGAPRTRVVWRLMGPSRMAHHPVTRTRLQGAAEWCYHSRQAGTPRKGDQPKDWRATDPKTSGLQPEDWTGRGFFFLHCRHLRVPPRLWRFRVRGRLRQCYNGLGLGISVLDGIGMVYRVPIFLFRSSPSLSSSMRHNFSLRAILQKYGCGRYQLFSMSRPSFASVLHRFQDHFPLSPSLFCERN